MIDTEADQDGDGIKNSIELKQGLDRSEFNFPRLSLSQTQIEVKSDFQSSFFKTSKQEYSYYHILPSSSLPQQYLLLPQMHSQERWLLEERAQREDVLQLELEGELSWDLSSILTFHYAKIDLGIYDWSTSEVLALDSYLVINQITQGKFHWSFTLSEEDKDRIKNRKMKWDFVLILSDSEWRSPLKRIHWNEIKEGYAHFLPAHSMAPKLYSEQVDPQVFIPKNSALELFQNDEQIMGIPIIKKGLIYHLQEKEFSYEMRELKKVAHSNYQMPVGNFKLKGLENHQWERIDLTLISPELSTQTVSRDVNVTWIGQKPCHVGGGRFQKVLCEGQSLVQRCTASYQELVSLPQEKGIPLEEVSVELSKSKVSLKDWIKMSGATILNNGKLIRWEGNTRKMMELRPFKLLWDREKRSVSYGYTGLQCPLVSSPAVQVLSHDQSRHVQEELWGFHLQQYQY